jgi:hypothetical protein
MCSSGSFIAQKPHHLTAYLTMLQTAKLRMFMLRNEYDEWIAKDVVRNDLGLICSMIPGLLLEMLSKTSRNVNEDK